MWKIIEDNSIKINKGKTKMMFVWKDSVEMKTEVDGIRLRVSPYQGVTRGGNQ